MYQCSKKLFTCKERCCFDYSDFPAHSMFTSDVCWGSLGTSIFGNSSSAASNTRSRLPSRLSFRFLWLWFEKYFQRKSAVKNQLFFFKKKTCVRSVFPASENWDMFMFSAQRRTCLLNVLNFTYKTFISENHA